MSYEVLKTVREYYLPQLTRLELRELQQAIITQITVNAEFYNSNPDKPLNESS